MISGQAFIDVSPAPKVKGYATNIFFLRDSLYGCLFCIQNHGKELMIYQINFKTTEIC